jgi:UTP--glucose-1-phosphate uridylyltransferase
VTITKAVIPAAGKGTRLYPATKSQPKEMLPLGTKPTIQHVVEELAAAGIREVLIVTGQRKRAIEDHFDADRQWIAELSNGESGDEGWPADVEVFYTRQSQQLGLGDAVSRARAFCGKDPFLVALGDCIISPPLQGPGVVRRLLDCFRGTGAAACIATYPVSLPDTARYGILAPVGEVTPPEPFPLRGIVEKPGPVKAPSTWAISARYAFSPAIFGAIEEGRRVVAQGEEVQLTDAIGRLVGQGLGVYGVPLAEGEVRLDVGDFRSYGCAFARVMATHPRYGRDFVDYLRRLLAYLEGEGADPDCGAT